MKRGIICIILTCLMVISIVLASCSTSITSVSTFTKTTTTQHRLLPSLLLCLKQTQRPYRPPHQLPRGLGTGGTSLVTRNMAAHSPTGLMPTLLGLTPI